MTRASSMSSTCSATAPRRWCGATAPPTAAPRPPSGTPPGRPATGCSWLHAERTSPDRPPRSSASRPPDFRAALEITQPPEWERPPGSSGAACRPPCPRAGARTERGDPCACVAPRSAPRCCWASASRRLLAMPITIVVGCAAARAERGARRAADAQCVPRFAGGGPARLRAGGRGAERLKGGPQASLAHPGDVGVAGRRHPYCQRWSSRRRCWSASRSGSGSSGRRGACRALVAAPHGIRSAPPGTQIVRREGRMMCVARTRVNGEWETSPP